MPRLRASGTKRGGTKSGGFAIDTAGAAARIDLVVGVEHAAAPRGAALEGGPRLPPRVVDGNEGEPARPRRPSGVGAGHAGTVLGGGEAVKRDSVVMKEGVSWILEMDLVSRVRGTPCELTRHERIQLRTLLSVKSDVSLRPALGNWSFSRSSSLWHDAGREDGAGGVVAQNVFIEPALLRRFGGCSSLLAEPSKTTLEFSLLMSSV